MLTPARSSESYVDIARSLAPIDALADAVIQIMRLLRTGPFGHEQRAWQDKMEEGGASIATHAPVLLAFERFDEINQQTPGTTAKSWSANVIDAGCEHAAEVLAEMHVLADHPLKVRQALFRSNLLPILASQRIKSSKETLCKVIVENLKLETIQSLRCPNRKSQYDWLENNDGYSHWMQQREAVREHAIYRSADSQWAQEMRSKPISLKVTLNAQAFDTVVQQRLWAQNRVRMAGTLYWHPKINNISSALLRSIRNTDDKQRAIAALVKHLEHHRFDTTASPLLVIESLEKSPDMSRQEMQQAVAFSIDKILKIHANAKPLASVLWNTLPTPWMYVPKQSELLAEDWNQFQQTSEKVVKSITKTTEVLMETHGHSLGSILLAWDRN